MIVLPLKRKRLSIQTGERKERSHINGDKLTTDMTTPLRINLSKESTIIMNTSPKDIVITVIIKKKTITDLLKGNIERYHLIQKGSLIPV